MTQKHAAYRDYNSHEAAMRALLVVQANWGSARTMSDLVARVRERIGCSHASGYRLVGMAADVLCLSFSDETEALRERMGTAVRKRHLRSVA